MTTIIHNAWRLDFNLSLASFEPNVKATRNLVDLALDSHYSSSLRFVFTSSVSTAQSWGPERGAFPEEIQLDPSWAVGPGYGESKYVCERVRRIIHSRRCDDSNVHCARSSPRAVSGRLRYASVRSRGDQTGHGRRRIGCRSSSSRASPLAPSLTRMA